MPLALADAWLTWWRYTAAWTWGGVASFARLSDTRSLRAFWSAQMTRTAERWMRSPEFLELMATGMRAMANVARLESQLRSK